MPHLSFPHLDWVTRNYESAAYNLADSGLAAGPLAELGLEGVPLISPRPRGDREQAEVGIARRLGAPGGRVMLAAGTSEANACVMAGLLEPGEEVLVERPGYEPHLSTPAAFGLSVRTFDRRAEDGWALRAGRVEERLTGRTRLVVVSDLHNPTCARPEPGELDRLGELAERRGLWLLVDEAFREADPDRDPGTAAGRGPRWLATSSLTKTFGLGGLRLGWVAGHAEALARCLEARRALSAEPTHASVAAAIRLLPRWDELRQAAHRRLAANREAWRGFLRGQGLDAKDVVPRGTVTWWNVGPGVAGDRFAEHALATRRVAVTPGRFFGDPGGVRVGLGAQPERFAAGLGELGAAWKDWKTPAGTRGESP